MCFLMLFYRNLFLINIQAEISNNQNRSVRYIFCVISLFSKTCFIFYAFIKEQRIKLKTLYILSKSLVTKLNLVAYFSKTYDQEEYIL
jgi:hypothetical protein